MIRLGRPVLAKIGAAGAVAAVAIGASVSGAPGARAATSPACTATSDPYSASDAQIQACGLKKVPLSSTTALVGGGTSYNYALSDGVTYSVIQPPANLDPATASSAELQTYGLTANSSTPNFAPVQKLPYMLVGASPLSTTAPPSSGTKQFGVVTNSNYGGYSESGSGINRVETIYTEPYLGNTPCSNVADGHWAGIGGGSSLGQTGTEDNANGALHQIFYENLPAGPDIPGVTVPAGSSFTGRTEYNGGNNWTYVDYVNGVEHLFGASGGSYNGSNAYVVSEVPTNSNLLNFQTINMSAQIGTNLAVMDANTKYQMTGLASTTNYNFGNGEFTVNWQNCD